MTLVQGSNDYMIKAIVSYQNDTNISLSELAEASSIEIVYKWISNDGDDSEEATWVCDGYGTDSNDDVYIYYQAQAEDIIPDGASYLVGRAVITDSDGFIAKGQKFQVQVQPDEL